MNLCTLYTWHNYTTKTLRASQHLIPCNFEFHGAAWRGHRNVAKFMFFPSVIRFPSYRPKNAKLFLLIFCSHPSILQFPLHFSTFLHPNLSHSAVRIPGCPRHPIRSPTRCPWAMETPLQAAPAGLLGLETRPRSPAKQLPEEDRFQRFIHSEILEYT